MPKREHHLDQYLTEFTRAFEQETGGGAIAVATLFYHAGRDQTGMAVAIQPEIMETGETLMGATLLEIAALAMMQFAMETKDDELVQTAARELYDAIIELQDEAISDEDVAAAERIAAQRNKTHSPKPAASVHSTTTPF